jgi:hypothetical protein
MVTPRDAPPSVRPKDDRHSDLKLARARQELWMRAFVLAVVVAIVLLCNAATVIAGKPSLGNASTDAASIGLLAWIVRRLFPKK